MSTVVPSTETSKHLAVEGYVAPGIVWVDFVDPGNGLRGSVRVTRADFLAAVETECGVRIVAADAIVIERAELPEVTPSGGCSGAGTQYLSAAGHEIADTSDASLVRVHALALLALAEHLDAHPPVPPVSDEDVETLAGLMRSDPQWAMRSVQGVARRLLATGRVSVTP